VTKQSAEKDGSESGKEREAEKEEEEGKMAEKSRWWDHYYVRYFVGSVFAVPLMLVLSKAEAVKSLGDLTGEDKLLNATILGAAGLAFCYLASAPILLLHATRGRHAKVGHTVGRVDKKSKIYSIIIIAFAVAVGVWIACDRTSAMGIPAWLSFVPFTAVVATQVARIWRSPISAIVGFYQRLAVERAHDPKEDLGRKRKEYIQSYRDMREHGNALLILVMEGVLTTALLQAANLGILLAMLVLWVMPAAFVWFVATALEADLDQVK
jgi:hypothetical protein